MRTSQTGPTVSYAFQWPALAMRYSAHSVPSCSTWPDGRRMGGLCGVPPPRHTIGACFSVSRNLSAEMRKALPPVSPSVDLQGSTRVMLVVDRCHLQSICHLPVSSKHYCLVFCNIAKDLGKDACLSAYSCLFLFLHLPIVGCHWVPLPSHGQMDNRNEQAAHTHRPRIPSKLHPSVCWSVSLSV
jgi:hypothetical protein